MGELAIAFSTTVGARTTWRCHLANVKFVGVGNGKSFVELASVPVNDNLANVEISRRGG